MAMNKIIVIKYESKEICKIESVNPSFTEITQFIVANDDIKPELIDIEPIEGFDNEGFISILQLSIKQYNDKKIINKNLYHKLMKKITVE